jgi:hypothetical protein
LLWRKKFDENFWFEYQKKIWKMIQHLDALNSLVSINKTLVYQLEKVNYNYNQNYFNSYSFNSHYETNERHWTWIYQNIVN